MKDQQTKTVAKPKAAIKPNQIIPCLWFDDQAKEAVEFYISVFSESLGEKNSQITGISHYLSDTPSNKPKGSILTVEFELYGQEFTALNGGPHFTFTPAISFIVNCGTEDEVNKLWDELSEDSTVLMPLDKYPFSDRYGWLEDKYGVSWQLILNQEGFSQKIIPSMLFVGDKAGKAEEAMNFYASIFDDAEIKSVFHYGADQQPDEEGTVMYGDFQLAGQLFAAMDSAQEHLFNFNEAISLQVSCEDQEEIDYFREKLSAVPEAEQCGWVKDKFGVSWQIVPSILPQLLNESDPQKATRVFEALMQMKKLDIEALKNA